jgi:hypothetical protein
MTALPDFYTYIKVIEANSGMVIRDGGEVNSPAKVTVRYVVVNDSHKVAGPWPVLGRLRRDGIELHPAGKVSVVPLESITVQPNTVWKKEWVVTEADGADASFVATMSGDPSIFGTAAPNEEDEKNNTAKMSFSIHPPVPK